MKRTLAKTTQAAPAVPPVEEITPELMEKLLMSHDLSGLKPEQRLTYYKALCQSLQLNPLTQPFEYLTLDGKMILYARKSCTDQLRKRDMVSVKVTSRAAVEGVYIVTAKASTPEGREDEDIGAVSLIQPDHVKEWFYEDGRKKSKWIPNPLAGHPTPPADRALAMMKCETKAKRRATLSICGLSIPDETEIDDITREHELGSRSDNVALNPERLAEERVRMAMEARQGSVDETASKTEGQHAPEEGEEWRDVTCHVGTATGALLGRKLGELSPRLIDWLNTNWRMKTVSPTDQDRALLAAITQAVIEGADKEDKAPEPPPKSTYLPEPKQKIAWRTVAVHLKSKVQGKTLEEVLTMSPAHLKAVGPLIAREVPGNEGERSLKDHILVNAYAEALRETGVAMDERELRSEIIERIDNLVITVDQADKLLQAAGAFGKDETILTIAEPALRYLILNWQAIEDVIRREFGSAK